MAYSYSKDNFITNNPYTKYGLNNPLSGLEPPTPEVNSNLKPLDRDNLPPNSVELERGEVVLQPNGQVYKTLGNKHGKNKATSGTPVSLPEGSFIYSDHKPLSISKEDKKLFRFQDGGKYKAKDNTPAKLVKKEVDIPHHNKMIAINTSDEHDDISKKSAELMLNKNFKKLGQVAYLQEEKKHFPDGLPGISQGTAPVANPQLQQEEDTQKQYKSGGSIPRYQMGKNLINPWMNDMNPMAAPETKPCHPADPDCHPSRRRLLTPSNTLPPVTVTNRHVRFPDGDLVFNPNGYTLPPVTIDPNRAPGISIAPPQNPYNTPPTTTDEEILPYQPDVPLSPDQKLSLGWDAMNAASVKRFYPKREQLQFTPVSLERTNAQPYLNQVNNAVSEAYQNNRGYNPIISRAQDSQLFGKALEQRSNILGNVQNQNNQIANQEEMYNNQGQNRVNNINSDLDNKYYDQVQQLDSNFSNEKKFAWNRVKDEYMGYKSQNNQLEMNLASQLTYGTIEVWQDPHTGRTSRYPVQGWVKKQQAAPLYDYDSKNNAVYFTGAGMSMDQLPNNSSDYSFQQISQMADEAQLTGVARGKFMASMMLAARNPYTKGRR